MTRYFKVTMIMRGEEDFDICVHAPSKLRQTIVSDIMVNEAAFRGLTDDLMGTHVASPATECHNQQHHGFMDGVRTTAGICSWHVCP